MRNRFGKTLSELMKQNDSIFYITADTGNAELYKNIDFYKDRYLNVGIAEQNMIGVASGLAFEGKTVVVNSIGNFPILRCYEQIRDDVAYHKLNVKICTTGGGLSYGPAGVTHHASEDFSVMRAMPHVKCFAPGDPDEVEKVTQLMMKIDGPCYLRIGYANEISIPKTKPLVIEFGKAVSYIEGNQVAIFTAGSILSEGYKAATMLNECGISTALCSFPTINPIDKSFLQDCFKKYDLIVTMEENVLNGGFGSSISEVYAQTFEKKSVIKMFGLVDEFPEIIGDRAYLEEQYHLTANDIVSYVKDYYKQNKI